MTLQIGFRHAFESFKFDISIEAPTPGVTVLFGASGAGKSTIAAVVAGLFRPSHYHIAINGNLLADSSRGLFTPPEHRHIGSVFQDARLFPHLTVAGNLRYGFNRARTQEIIGVDEVVRLLGIEPLLGRRPRGLSGGERQRVAIGRALLSQPRLLIMDEPLASLDAARRAEILPYLARLRDTLDLPILYVTHALDEVARLADTLVLIENGNSIAAGPLAEVLARTDLGLAARDDAAAVLDCHVVAHLPQRGLTRLSITGADGAELLVPLQALNLADNVRARIPAGEIILARQIPGGISIHNALPAKITSITVDRHAALVQMRLGAALLLARVTSDAIRQMDLNEGTELFALIKSVAIKVLA